MFSSIKEAKPGVSPLTETVKKRKCANVISGDKVECERMDEYAACVCCKPVSNSVNTVCSVSKVSVHTLDENVVYVHERETGQCGCDAIEKDVRVATIEKDDYCDYDDEQTISRKIRSADRSENISRHYADGTCECGEKGDESLLSVAEDVTCDDEHDFLFKKIKNQFSFLHWNVRGFLSKLDDSDFVQYITSFDFVCIVETFLETFNSSMFKSHKVFVQPAVKLSHHGRCSGGIICLVRKNCLPYISEIKNDSEMCLSFLLDKDFFGFRKNVLLWCCYLPCENSPYYRVTGYDNGIDMIEDCIAEQCVRFDNTDILLCGDFNARMSDNQAEFIEENDIFSNETNMHIFEKDQRNCKDKVVNNYGRKLLNVCSVYVTFTQNARVSGLTLLRY